MKAVILLVLLCCAVATCQDCDPNGISTCTQTFAAAAASQAGNTDQLCSSLNDYIYCLKGVCPAGSQMVANQVEINMRAQGLTCDLSALNGAQGPQSMSAFIVLATSTIVMALSL